MVVYTPVTWFSHMCDMTHSCAWHDSIRCVTWLNHMYDMTQSIVWHDSVNCVTWPMVWQMLVDGHLPTFDHLVSCTHLWHDTVIFATWLCRIYNVTLMSDMPQSTKYLTYLSGVANVGVQCSKQYMRLLGPNKWIMKPRQARLSPMLLKTWRVTHLRELYFFFGKDESQKQIRNSPKG